MKRVEFGGYDVRCVFKAVDDALRAEIMAFWTGNKAIGDPEQAKARAGQVAWVARDPNGALVALCTLYTETFGERPHWYFRCYTSPAARRAHLAFNFVGLCRKTLLEHRRPEDQQAGLVIVAQNPGLMTEQGRKAFRDWGWSHEGVQSGYDVWRLGWDTMDVVLPPDIQVRE